MTPLLSIVVPTKNRYKYLKYLVSYFTTIDSDKLELIIQDNSDNNSEILDFMQNITDSRVRYFYSSELLTINENSDRAILLSTGKYVCFIGDDDAFLPNVLDAIELMESHNAQAATFVYLEFVWPDCKGTRKWNDLYPYKLKHFSKNATIHESTDELIKVMKDGAYAFGKMPKVYQGIVERDCLYDVYTKYGSFFPAGSPDMANSVALSLQNIKVIYIDFPFVFAGTGRVRVASNVGGDNERDLSKLSFLDPFIKENWDKRIPKIWTGQTIFPQTIITVLEKAGRSDMIKNLNFYNSYTMFIKNHPQDADMVFKILTFPQYPLLLFNAIKFVSHILLEKLVTKIKNRGSIIIEREEFSNIVDYIDRIQEINESPSR